MFYFKRSTSNSLEISKKKINKENVENSDQNIYFIIREIHICSRILGLMCFSINYDDQKRPKNVYLSIFDILLLLLSICIRIYSIFSFAQMYTVHLASTVQLFLIGATVICTVLFSTLIIDSVFDVLNRKKILKIFQKFYAIDDDLKSIGIQIKNRNAFCFVSAFTITTIAIEIIQSVFASYVYAEFIRSHGGTFSNWRFALDILYTYGSVTVLKNNLMCLVFVKSRLKLIRKRVKAQTFQFRSKSLTEEIKLLRQNYDALVDLVEDINSCFAFQVSNTTNLFRNMIAKKNIFQYS